MATWDFILSHYYFDSKHYSEFTDPADLSKAYVDVVLEYLLLGQILIVSYIKITAMSFRLS